MINGKSRNGNGHTQIVESICALDERQYKVQIKYKWEEVNSKRACCMVHGSIKILKVIR